MAQDVAELPGQDDPARTDESVGTSAATAATVSDAQEAVEDVATLKARIAEYDQKLQHAEKKRIPDLMSAKDRAEGELKKAQQRLSEYPNEVLAWIEEGARRNLSAAQLLQLMRQKQQERATAAQSATPARDDSSQKLIIREMRAGNTAFAEFLADLSDDVPVTENNIETFRKRFEKLTPATSSDAAATAQNGNGKPGAVIAPRVASGHGGPGRAKGPAWRPGMKPGALLEAAYAGKEPGAPR